MRSDDVTDARWDPPDTAPRQLSPWSMVVGIELRSLIFGAVAILSTGAFGAFLLVVAAGIVVVQVLQWRAFHYGFDGRVVRVEEGVLQRRTRSIQVGRIQQVEIDQPLAHRLVGLAVLRVETASEGGQTEVTLNGVGLEEAEALRSALRAVGSDRPVETTADAAPSDVTEPRALPERQTVLEVPVRDLALSAITGVQLLAMPAALAVLAEAASDVGATDALGERAIDVARASSLVALAGLLLLGAALAFVAAVVATILRDGGYRVDVRGDDVVVRRGLLTTREAVLPRHRVQVVEVRQNWVRRALGAAAVHVRSAGGGAAADQSRRITVPLVRPGQDLDRLLDVLLPDRPAPSAFRSHPPAARRRAVVRTTIRLGAVAAMLAVLALGLGLTEGLSAIPWQAPAVTGGMLLALGPVLGLAEYRHLAHALGEHVVASRHGALGVTTSYAPLARLQGVTQQASPFQRRLDLASVEGHLAGTGGAGALVVLDVARTTAHDLREDLTVAASGATTGQRGVR